jgi:signal transduction histidine kinase
VASDVARARDAARAVSLVVDGLVHDLNNPLTILLANLEMVLQRLHTQQPLDGDDVEALDECFDASRRLAALLRAARGLSRPSTQARVALVLEAAARATKQPARDRAVRPQLQSAPADLLVAGDEPRLALAFTSVVDRLVQATAGASASIIVSARVDGDVVWLEACARGDVDRAQLTSSCPELALAAAIVGPDAVVVDEAEVHVVVSLRLPVFVAPEAP